MNNYRIKIVTDSSSDLRSYEKADFAAAPLKISTAEKEFTDDSSLDTLEMVTYLGSYSGRSTTSCPNTEDWLKAFGDADVIFCITMTSALSGTYNSAMLAKRTYEEKYEGKRVFVIDSLSTGPEMALIADRISELIQTEASPDDLYAKAEEYKQSTGLLFMLESMKNLANNGRVSPIAAKMAGILGIRIVGKASVKGELELLEKCRGEKRAIEEMYAQMKAMGYSGGKVKLTSCFNKNAAEQLDALIKAEYPQALTEIYACGGLCSFYAENHGMLVGFEHN